MATPQEGLPNWGTDDVTQTIDDKSFANKVAPPVEVRNSGILYQEPAARQWINYQFNLIRKWVEELDIRTTGGSVQTGWYEYIDGTYTSASPLTVSATNTVAIPNDGGTIITTGAPTNGDVFWDGSKIPADNEGDAFLLGITLTAESSDAGATMSIKLDDGAIIAEQTSELLRGIDTAHKLTYHFPFHVDTNFITNGGVPKIEAVSGNIDIYDISFFIQRTYYKDNT